MVGKPLKKAPVQPAYKFTRSEIEMFKPALIALAVACALAAACSGSSPVAPGESTLVGGPQSARSAPALPGVYGLSFRAFLSGGFQEVISLPVNSELILMAHVTDGAGQSAPSGTATFEYCSYKGRSNDITRADEAPKEACEQGLASWARLANIPVDAGRCPGFGAGYACFNFGLARIPRDVGFRFRYSPQGSAIAAGTSVAKNFTWTE
jgi:hypothetical protein